MQTGQLQGIFISLAAAQCEEELVQVTYKSMLTCNLGTLVHCNLGTLVQYTRSLGSQNWAEFSTDLGSHADKV